jgi:hypothetical protein
MLLKRCLKQDGKVLIGLVWLRIGTDGELLWIFWFYTILRISWVADQLLDSKMISLIRQNDYGVSEFMDNIRQANRCRMFCRVAMPGSPREGITHPWFLRTYAAALSPSDVISAPTAITGNLNYNPLKAKL